MEKSGRNRLSDLLSRNESVIVRTISILGLAATLALSLTKVIAEFVR